MSIIKKAGNSIKNKSQDQMSLEAYLTLCKNDPMAYASAAERMVKAIGEPEIVDTSKDVRLSRIFQNRTIKVYPAFKDFYGMEEAVERIVGYFTHSAQGLEEKKQIMYLLGPVGGGKSSLAEKLKDLMETFPIYVLAYQHTTVKVLPTEVTEVNGVLEISPVFESPLGLFGRDMAADLESEYGISGRYINGLLSPWAIKRLDESDGSLDNFKVVKVYPSRLRQVAIVKTEPGDDNNQDISSLVGKVDIRKLENFSQNDPDSYSFSGALCRANQGLMEFVEMFKAPIKMLHPLLTATQEGNYTGTEAISAIPFNGVVVAHSNESEWQQFKSNKSNEAFIDRVCVIKVPYCLRVNEEAMIYDKMLQHSSLKFAPCAPQTLEMLAQFSVLTRLKTHENSTLFSKMRVYNGDNIKDVDPRAKNIHEYKDEAGVDEGMNGTSTRFAFKVLSQTFNFDSSEVAADPVHLMYVLENAIKREQLGEDKEREYLEFIKENLARKYADHLGLEIQRAYVESYGEYGQAVFNNYIGMADAWISGTDFKHPDTGQIFDREILNKELEKIEKPAQIVNAKDFRSEVVNFVLRAERGGNTVKWTAYEKMREVIEKRMFTSLNDLLPVISFGSKQDKETEVKHEKFVSRMMEHGYSAQQVRRLSEWFIRFNKNS
jgi:serine protein kinase